MVQFFIVLCSFTIFQGSLVLLFATSIIWSIFHCQWRVAGVFCLLTFGSCWIIVLKMQIDSRYVVVYGLCDDISADVFIQDKTNARQQCVFNALPCLLIHVDQGYSVGRIVINLWYILFILQIIQTYGMPQLHHRYQFLRARCGYQLISHARLTYVLGGSELFNNKNLGEPEVQDKVFAMRLSCIYMAALYCEGFKSLELGMHEVYSYISSIH